MRTLAVLLVAMMIAACNPTKKDASSLNADNNKNAQGGAIATEPAKQAAQDQSVYFEFAKSSIDPQYNRTIEAEVKSMKSHKGEAVTLEGNCDERGSAEYNLGLGQRRADAVKKHMVAAGIPAREIKVTSFGKEKPKATCHDESCWKENRRVDFTMHG